jgi:hypothetical protein
MQKCIEDVKEKSFDIIEDIDGIVKIKKKPTKKKIMEFHIIRFKGKPFIQIYVNDKFYETTYMLDDKWIEETKDFEGS